MLEIKAIFLNKKIAIFYLDFRFFKRKENT